MKILVTGSNGRLGTVVMRDLRASGHDPIGVDVHPGDNNRIADLTRVSEIAPLLAGCDAVCHLGNFPSFEKCATQAEGFANNVNSTYAVFEACARAGVRNIVYASSIQAYGFYGNDARKPLHVSQPRYFPIDEDHPLLPRDGYPLSKATGEWIADSFVRADSALQVFSLRFTWIRTEQDTVPDLRPEPSPEHPFPLVGSMFTQIPVADAARAVRLCCEARRPGHTQLNIVAAKSMWPWTAELIEPAYGPMPELRTALRPEDALISGARAAAILGFHVE